jgi:hypothetical protein
MWREDHEGKTFGPYEYTLEMNKAFCRLQSKFTQALVLTHFDYARTISLEMDASGFAIAGIIL